MNEALYQLLESVVGDVDSFTIDQQLLAESPDFYLNEVELREKIRQAYIRIVGLVH